MNRFLCDLYIAPEGTVFINEGRFIGAFGEMMIPSDVLQRGHRLQKRGLYGSQYEYAAKWCHRRLEDEWQRVKSADSPAA